MSLLIKIYPFLFEDNENKMHSAFSMFKNDSIFNFLYWLFTEIEHKYAVIVLKTTIATVII